MKTRRVAVGTSESGVPAMGLPGLVGSDAKGRCQKGCQRADGPSRCDGLGRALLSSGNTRRVESSLLESQRGQSTVEYALVLTAFLSIAVALAVVWHASRSGRLLDLATQSASHQIGGGDALGSWRDISLF